MKHKNHKHHVRRRSRIPDKIQNQPVVDSENTGHSPLGRAVSYLFRIVLMLALFSAPKLVQHGQMLADNSGSFQAGQIAEKL